MTPAIALFIGAYVLIRAGWLGQPIMDVLLLRKPVPKDPDLSAALGVLGRSDAAQRAGAQSHKGGTRTFDGKPVASWIVPVLKFARSHGWAGGVTSGFRDPKQVVTPSPGLPVAPQGKSNHNTTVWPGGAVDVSDPDGFAAALGQWPGPTPLRRDPSINDPVHFSVSGR